MALALTHSRSSAYVAARIILSSSSLSLNRPRRRNYTILGSGAFKPKQYTKYRITTDFSANSDHDDLYLAEPSKDDFVKLTKDEPIFLRFLKLVADQEQRPEAFKDFARRCEVGLVVEKDVYVTKTELLAALWENGYSELELNAYEIAFPADYHFHYPELAVLFDIEEEDCYKYCLRKRAAKPDNLVEVKHRPTPSKIASYGFLTTAVWFGLQNNVLGNIWMMVKTWPFFAVFYMLGSHFQKSIMGKIHSDSALESRVSLENRLEGEDHVYLQMKKYANDSLCLDYLESFKPSVQRQLIEYRRAALVQMREKMIEGMTKHLVAVQQAERAIESSLQEVIVRETATAFQEAYRTQDDLRSSSFDAAIEALSHSEEVVMSDPVGDFFKNSFRELNKAPKSGRPSGHVVVDRVNQVFESQEKDFLNQYTVTEAETKEVRELNDSVCRKVGVDDSTGRPNFQNLSPEQFKAIENLYNKITSKVGLDSLPLPIGTPSMKSLESRDKFCAEFLAQINQSAQSTEKHLRHLQLQSFMKAFA